MAQAIIVDGINFTINGAQYPRIYIPLRVGATGIAIVCVYDTRLQLIPTTPYTEFTVGGSGFASQELAMVGLNSALYANPADGTIGGNSLFSTRIAAFTQIAAGGTSYVNIGAMDMQNCLLNDGEGVHIKYGGTIDYSSLAPTIAIQGFSTNLIIGAVDVAGIGSAHDWTADVDIMRISSSSMKWTATFQISNTTPQILGGEKTGLDFTIAHAAAITWTNAPAGDDFELYYGYVNKLA